MTLDRAIRLAQQWASGGVCSLRDGEAREYHKLALAALRAKQKEEKNEPLTPGKWISVKNRLPEDDLPKNTHRKMIRCLVATDKGTVKPCVRQRYDKPIGGKWKICPWEWNKDLYAKPTHWMPLPEPPKEE